MKLYIFVTSDRPDQYLNSIVHCIEQGIRNVVFLQVKDSQFDQVQLNLLRANVYNLLQSLSSGFYKHFVGARKDEIVDLATEYSTEELERMKARYSFHLSDNIDWKIERVQYSDLRPCISQIAKSKDSIIDVTSVAKVYMGDIFACSLLENINELRTFELFTKPNFDQPWKTLIHELEEGTTYKYTNLVETPIFKASSKAILIRTTPLLISVIGTVIFLAIALIGAFAFGFSGVFSQVISVIGTVSGIVSFLLIYFPVRGK